MSFSPGSFQLGTLQYMDTSGKLAKGTPPIESNILVDIYTTMLRTRYIDSRMTHLQRQGDISFSMGSYGEEASIVATAAALDGEDWIYPQYREQGAIFWRGWSIEKFVHHMFCNEQDIIIGRQMPNHFGDKELNIVTVSSPVGTQIPQAAGAGYAMKLNNSSQVALCFFGEGTASEGDFHAGLNFAAVKSSQTIFLCRNNDFAISTNTENQYKGLGIAERGVGYNMQTYRIDGNDTFAIYHTIKEAKKFCLEGKGPVLIEAMTYRLGGHSTSDDPSVYRSSDEVDDKLQTCPMKRLRLYLEKHKLWDQDQEDQALKQVKEETDKAICVARKTPPPKPATIIEDVYFEVPQKLKQQFNAIQGVY